MRDADRRRDPTEEYDQIAVAVCAAVLLLLPLVEDFASPWAGLAGGLVGLACGLAAALGPGEGAGRVSKFTPIDDELHAYMVEHGARQDEALRRVQAETEAMGDIAVMQIAADQGAFMTLLARAISRPRGARGRHVHRLFGRSASLAGLGPGGRLLCCELSEEYAEIAARNFEAAGVADRIEIRIGPALDTLRALPESEALRHRLHRRRQGQLSRVLRGGAGADRPGRADPA